MKMPPPPGLVKADLVSKLVQHLLQPQDRSTQHARAAHVERSLRFHSFPATNEHRVAESFMGLIEKFDLYGQQEKAHELEALFNKANQLVGTTSRVKKIALYDALALLLHMSLAPLKSSYQARKSYEENSSVSLTWEDILREEPLEGDHWRPVRQEGRTRWSRWDSEDSNWSEDDEAGEIDRASAVDVEEVAPVPGLVVEDSHLPDQLPQTSFRVDHADAEKSAKAMYWDPNRPQRSVPSEDHHFKASEPTSLMPSLAVKQSSEPSFFGVPAFSTNFVSELDVILESIHVLFGLPADLYDLDSSGCYSVRGTASLKHLSEGTLHSIMDRFCAWGNLIVRLQRFAKSTLKERTLVLEAFASVTEKRLDRFFEWLSNLERQYMNIMCEDSGKGGIGVLQTVSLIQLAELVRCKIDLLMPLDSVILEVGFANSQKHPSTLLLDRLWAELGVYQHACDAHMFINLLLVLFETMRPWIDRIEDWFLSNEIVDLFNELPIVFHPNVRKNYWTESYSICNERLPQILSANMDAIARIGKGLHILHELYPSMCSDCLGEESRTSLHQRLFLAVQKHFHLASVASSDDTSAPLTSAQSSAGIAPELELLLFESMEIADAPEAIKIVSMAEISKDEEPIFREDYEQVLLPLTQTWDLALSSALLPLDKSVGKCVLQQMFSSSQLELHLRVIKDFFLLGQGSVMTSFCDALMELDQNVWKRPTAVQHSFLAALLADGASFDGLDVTDTVRFRVASNNEQPTGLPLIECLKISYDAPWPINTIITPPLLDHYCNVMVFVLQILWTKRRMAQVASLGQHRRLPKEFTKTRAFRFQTLLKRRMDVFCESLHHFCMVAVVEQEYQRFLVSIKGSADLGEAIRIHEKFAVSLVELLLIDEKTTVLKNAIRECLGLCVRFADASAKYITSLERSAASTGAKGKGSVSPAGTSPKHRQQQQVLPPPPTKSGQRPGPLRESVSTPTSPPRALRGAPAAAAAAANRPAVAATRNPPPPPPRSSTMATRRTVPDTARSGAGRGGGGGSGTTERSSLRPGARRAAPPGSPSSSSSEEGGRKKSGGGGGGDVFFAEAASASASSSASFEAELGEILSAFSATQRFLVSTMASLAGYGFAHLEGFSALFATAEAGAGAGSKW